MPEGHTITELRRMGSGKGLEVFVDGEKAWRMHHKLAERLGLAVGLRLSPDELVEVGRGVATYETRAAALRLLGQRARSQAALRQRLLSKGCPEWAADETLAWLTEREYLNDERYAQERVAGLQRRRLGSRVIADRLHREGVPDELAKAVMAERADELHETELARELAEQLDERWRALEWLRRRNRIYQHLARRGFGSEVISTALARLEPLGSSSEVM